MCVCVYVFFNATVVSTLPLPGDERICDQKESGHLPYFPPVHRGLDYHSTPVAVRLSSDKLSQTDSHPSAFNDGNVLLNVLRRRNPYLAHPPGIEPTYSRPHNVSCTVRPVRRGGYDVSCMF